MDNQTNSQIQVNGTSPSVPSTSNQSPGHKRSRAKIAIWLVILALAILTGFTIPALLFLIFAPALIIYAFVKFVSYLKRTSGVGNQRRQAALSAFAQKNNLQFNLFPNKEQFLADDILKGGIYSMTLADAVYDSQTAFFRCVTGSRNPINFMVRRAPMPNATTDFMLSPPHHILDGIALSGGGGNSSGDYLFKTDGFEKQDLGGEVQKTFQLYATTGAEAKALSILSPTVLQWLVANAPSATIIVRQQVLYVFIRGYGSLSETSESSNNYQHFYDLSKQIVEYLQNAR